jgi:hypothetical protein
MHPPSLLPPLICFLRYFCFGTNEVSTNSKNSVRLQSFAIWEILRSNLTLKPRSQFFSICSSSMRVRDHSLTGKNWKLKSCLSLRAWVRPPTDQCKKRALGLRHCEMKCRERYQGPAPWETRAKAIVNTRIRRFESLSWNIKLTKGAREMLRIPVIETADSNHDFDAGQVDELLDRILETMRVPDPQRESRYRNSIDVIRALHQNFCNIPPFCSGKRNE